MSELQTGEGPMPFIPAQLDDLELTAQEFRIVCRVARRRECTESVPRMANGCHMHKQTVWACLAKLEILQVISREARQGQTTLLRVRPPGEWIKATNPTETETRPKRRPRSSNRSHPTETETRHPTETETHKGYPLKVSSKVKRIRATFSPPSVEQVAAYFKVQNFNPLDAQRFCDHHQQTHWTLKSGPMLDWEASCRTWISKAREWGRDTSAKAPTLQLTPAEDERRKIAKSL